MFNIRISEVEGASQPVRDCTDNYWIWEEGRNLIFRFVKKKKKIKTLCIVLLFV